MAVSKKWMGADNGTVHMLRMYDDMLKISLIVQLEDVRNKHTPGLFQNTDYIIRHNVNYLTCETIENYENLDLEQAKERAEQSILAAIKEKAKEIRNEMLEYMTEDMMLLDLFGRYIQKLEGGDEQ